MFRSKPAAALLALLFVLLATPALAHASGQDVLKDCGYDFDLDRTYSQADLASAMAGLTSDLDEYSPCRELIRDAQLAGLRGGGASGGASGGGGSAGGTGAGATAGGAAGGAVATDDRSAGPPPGSDEAVAATATPDEQASIERAIAGGLTPVALDGRPVSATALGGATGRRLGDLPAPLVALLALLAAGLAAGAGAAGHRFWAMRRGF